MTTDEAIKAAEEIRPPGCIFKMWGPTLTPGRRYIVFVEQFKDYSSTVLCLGFGPSVAEAYESVAIELAGFQNAT